MKLLKKILKWTGIILLSLVALIFIAYTGIYISTEKQIGKNYWYSEAALRIPMDSASVEKGKHLYQIRSCEDCHGAKGEGKVFIDDPMLMRLTSANLTRGRGGLPVDFDVDDWVRVIRHGVDRNGKSLFMMPSHELYKLTDEDLASLIAYCMQLEPVHTTYEELRTIGPIGRILMFLDHVSILPAEKIDHNASFSKKLEEKVSVEYGEYLASNCQGCHRANLQGGAPLAPGFPPVPNITTMGNPGKWNDRSFITTIRTGKTPEGKNLDNNFMPWQSMRNFTDDELKSIHLYLQSLPYKH